MSDEELREAYLRATAARRDPGRGGCPGPEALQAAIRRDGPERQRLETLDHAMRCAACRREFELLRAIEVGRRAEAGEGVRRIRFQRPLVIALAASLLLAVALGPGLGWLRGPSPDVVRDAPDGGALAAILPADGAVVDAGAPLDFVWHPLPGAGRYDLELLTPGGAVEAAVRTADTTATLAAGTLPPGEHRWIVRAATPAGEQRSVVRRLVVRARPDA